MMVREGFERRGDLLGVVEDHREGRGIDLTAFASRITVIGPNALSARSTSLRPADRAETLRHLPELAGGDRP